MQVRDKTPPLSKALVLASVLCVVLSACTGFPVGRGRLWDGQILYLALIWH
jgi:hypothetical protein